MTKKDLLPLAKTYFDSDPNRAFIFGTEDRHFYNSEGDVKAYSKGLIKYFQFFKSDFNEEEIAKRKAEEDKLRKAEEKRLKKEKELVDKKAEDDAKILHDQRKELLTPLWEFLGEDLHEYDFSKMEEKDFNDLITDLESKKTEKDEELVMAEQIKKEDLLKSRQELMIPYKDFKSELELTLDTSEDDFNKILDDLKTQESNKNTEEVKVIKSETKTEVKVVKAETNKK